jgi:hypothetical protein
MSPLPDATPAVEALLDAVAAPLRGSSHTTAGPGREREGRVCDTVLICERDHHHLHSGRSLVLKDGRRLDQNGWQDEPAA